jgi:copper transport protein
MRDARQTAGLRRLLALASACLAIALTVLVAAPAPPVLAHATLVASIPAPSSTLSTAPDAVVLEFDETIEAGLSSIQLFDADERLVEIGEARAAPGNDRVVSADLPDLDDGLYAVVWRVASADGHIVTGAFGFVIGAGGDLAGLVDQVAGGATADPAVTRAADVAKFVLYIGLVLLMGVGAWSLLLTDERLAGARARLPAIGWLLAFVGTLAGYALYGAAAVAGSLGDAFDPEVWGRIDGTQTGRMTLVRLLLLAALGVLLALLRRRPSARATMWWRQTAVALSIGALITLPAAGHPSATSPRALYVLLDAVHLVAIVLWMGGLALFAAGRTGWLEHDDVAPVARTFSRTAGVLVPVIVLTGALQAWELAGGVEDLTDTSWGRTLLVKLSVVSVIVAIGAVSRWLLQNVGVPSIRRTVMAEAALGTVVLAFTASLVTLPPTNDSAGEVFNATLTQAGLIADITVTPGRVGSNEVHLVLTPPGGAIQPVVSAQARMSLDSEGVPATPVSLEPDGPNHYTGTITLPFDGEWSLDLIVEVTQGNTLLLTTTVPIPD